VPNILHILLVSAAFMGVDLVWLGLVMPKVYSSALGPLARRTAAGTLDPYWPTAIVVYVLLVASLFVFVRPLVAGGSLPYAFAIGALLGVIIYGVYDFTNHATLAGWPLWLAFLEVERALLRLTS
jgi:uncharacterized membrane protein